MFLIVAIAELCRVRVTLRAKRAREASLRPAIGMVAVTLTLVAVPLLYYYGLGHLDEVWRAGQQRARHSFSTTSTLIAAAPLLACALLGYRGRPEDTLELLLRAWVPAAVLIWVFSQSALGATPLHAVGGLPLPMAVLAVRGAHRARLDRLPRARALACLAIALVTVPATVYTMAYAHTFLDPQPDSGGFVAHGESAALGYLARSRTPGGVVSALRLGQAVPGTTGRATYVGDCLWSEPRCDVRKRQTAALLAGRMGGSRARSFVASTGARFVLGGCGADRRGVSDQLAPLLVATRRFGCATVWQLRAPGPGRG
jgi:hypothetical protein